MVIAAYQLLASACIEHVFFLFCFVLVYLFVIAALESLHLKLQMVRLISCYDNIVGRYIS